MALAGAFGVDGFVSMRQVHGAHVTTVRSLDMATPTCDALVTDTPDVALCVRVGDCVPLVLADARNGVVGVAHVGRPGVTAGTVAATLQAMSRLGAERIEAWVGPHVCGGCYEVPAAMRDEVADTDRPPTRARPGARPRSTSVRPSWHSWCAAGCSAIIDVGGCTLESEDFFSYRRQGPSSGRPAGLVVVRTAR